MKPSLRRRRAFTLIELLIAFAVLAVVTFMLYQMLIRGTRGAQVGIWRGTTQKRLQTAAERIRKVLEGASFPSVLTPEYNLVDEAEDHYVVLGAGNDGQARDLEITEGQDETDKTDGGQYRAIGPGRKGGSDGHDGDKLLILAATNCSPAQKRIAGFPDKQGEATHVYFWLERKRDVYRGNLFEGVMDLMYKEVGPEEYGDGVTMRAGASISVPGHPLGEAPSGGKLLVSDVNSVRLRVLSTDAGDKDATPVEASPGDAVSADDKPTLEIGIRCVEPLDGKAVLGKVIKVQLNTGVKFE